MTESSKAAFLRHTADVQRGEPLWTPPECRGTEVRDQRHGRTTTRNPTKSYR